MTKEQKYRDVTRFLRSKGWEFKRQAKGSHEMWGPETGNAKPISLVAHKGNVSVGVVREIKNRFHGATPPEWE